VIDMLGKFGELLEQYYIPIGVVSFVVGVTLWRLSERKFRKQQRDRDRKIFNEVNSKKYDEENIQ